jgi:hypothetical protein
VLQHLAGQATALLFIILIGFINEVVTKSFEMVVDHQIVLSRKVDIQDIRGSGERVFCPVKSV